METESRVSPFSYISTLLFVWCVSLDDVIFGHIWRVMQSFLTVWLSINNYWPHVRPWQDINQSDRRPLWVSRQPNVSALQSLEWKLATPGCPRRTERSADRCATPSPVSRALSNTPRTHAPAFAPTPWEHSAARFAPGGIMSCLQRTAQLSGSQELRHLRRSQKMIQTNAKILGRAEPHVPPPRRLWNFAVKWTGVNV